MSKHLVGDVVALANQGKTREEIAVELGVTVASVSRRLRYAKRLGKNFLCLNERSGRRLSKRRNRPMDDIAYYINTAKRLRKTAAEMMALGFEPEVIQNILDGAMYADRAADALLMHAKAAAA